MIISTSTKSCMKALKISSIGLILLLMIMMLVARGQANSMVTHPLGQRLVPNKTPADLGITYEDVTVRTLDDFLLEGWLVPTRNGAMIIMQHGYKYHRGGFIDEIVMLARAGYGVLVTTVRAHENNPGEQITFGVKEMMDIHAWVQFALALPNVDSARLGMIGDSMGGSMVIQYAASNETIRAVVAHSAFSSLEDTIATSVRHYTGLPAFPFAPMIQFWAEMKLGIDASAVDAKRWIGDISPRPILIINSLDDEVISPESGKLLFDAAGEPKELWEEKGVAHADFDAEYPEEYEDRVVSFFNRHLIP